MGELMGDPTESEHGNPDNCDTQQLTTTGLAYWRCSTNVMTFAAFPDGLAHWAWVPDGLVEWSAQDVDPPLGAPIVRAARALVAEGQPAAACLAAAELPSMPCSVADDVLVKGTILSPGDTGTFHFRVPSPGVQAIAELANLPADYDLYLADSSGAIMGQSVQDGTTSERVAIGLDSGTYYLYVHADVGRPVDAQNPYQLELRFASQPATGAVSGSP
jgi:hypothetical protein